MARFTVLLIAMSLVALTPAALAEHGDESNEAATWGLCQAKEESQPGDEASNGTVSESPPFSDLSEEECEEAQHPASGTPGEDRIPENPGQDNIPDHPGGDDHPDGEDHPDQEDNPGGDAGDQEPEHPDQDDHPDEEDRPGQP